MEKCVGVELYIAVKCVFLFRFEFYALNDINEFRFYIVLRCIKLYRIKYCIDLG